MNSVVKVSERVPRETVDDENITRSLYRKMDSSVEGFQKLLRDTASGGRVQSSVILRRKTAIFLDKHGPEQLVEAIENEICCPVCLEIPIEASLTMCRHIFCKFCVMKCQLDNAKCPNCRAILTDFLPKPLIQTDRIIVKVMSENDAGYLTERRRTILERNWIMLNLWLQAFGKLDNNVRKSLRTVMLIYCNGMVDFPPGKALTKDIEVNAEFMEGWFRTVSRDIRPLWSTYLANYEL